MNYKNVPLILVLLYNLNCFSQERKFNFGAVVFPCLSFGLITNDGTASEIAEEQYRELEVGKISMSGGLFTEFNLTKNAKIGLGLGFQQNGEATRKTELIFEPVPDPALPKQVKFVYNRYNFEVPVYFKRHFGQRSFVSIGSSLFLNITNTTTSVAFYDSKNRVRNSNKDEMNDFRFVNISVNVVYGIELIQREKFNLFLQPSVQYGILGVVKNAPLNRNFLLIGIASGIKF